METDPSRLQLPKTERAAPAVRAVTVDRELPSRTNDLIDIELPTEAAVRDKEEPSVVVLLTERELPNLAQSKRE